MNPRKMLLLVAGVLLLAVNAGAQIRYDSVQARLDYQKDLTTYNTNLAELAKKYDALKPAVAAYGDRVRDHNAHQCTEVNRDGSCNAYVAEKNFLDAEQARLQAAYAALDVEKATITAEYTRLNNLSTELDKQKEAAKTDPCSPSNDTNCTEFHSIKTVTPLFTAIFNNTVYLSNEPNTAKTSTDTLFQSKAGTTLQMVDWRSINGNIEVNKASLDVYVGNHTRHGETLTLRDDSPFKGFPFSASLELVTKEGRYRRIQIFIVDSKTMFQIIQDSSADGPKEKADWLALTESFTLHTGAAQ